MMSSVRESEALIRIDFILGAFHQLISNLHKKVTSTVTENVSFSESIPVCVTRVEFVSKFPHNDVIVVTIDHPSLNGNEQYLGLECCKCLAYAYRLVYVHVRQDVVFW